MIKDIISNKKLIAKLAKNDFKQKFAGSTLGVIWAFVQPVVTVLVYWIVFDKALNAGTQGTKAGIDAPFVLWLSAGIVPWFYFSEVLSAGTVVLQEYNYLVKKVLFKISILPIIKILAAMFIHVFFIGVLMVIACIYGYYPNIYWLQFIYYVFCEFILVLSLSYATCSIVVFFRDLGQVISILLQVGIEEFLHPAELERPHGGRLHRRP